MYNINDGYFIYMGWCWNFFVFLKGELDFIRESRSFKFEVIVVNFF